MAKKGIWDVIFLVLLGIFLMVVTPLMPFDELGAFFMAFLRAVR